MALELMIPNTGSIFYDNSPGFSTIKIPTQTELHIFKQKTLIAPAISQNALGLYTMVPVGRDGEARFGSFSTPRFTLSGRSSKACVWNPKNCGVSFGVQTIPVCPVEHQSELCVDVLWNSCWEKLLGLGNDVYDIQATAEGAAFLSHALDKLHEGIGNDFWYLLTFGGHPYIEMADEKGWWKKAGVDKKTWDCFYDMMTACGGHLTMIDSLKIKENLPNFNVEISEGDVKGSKYVGDAQALFDRLKENAGPELSNWNKSVVAPGSQDPLIGASNRENRLVIAVTPGIFNKYKEELKVQYKNIPESFYLTLYGEDYGCQSCGNKRLRGVLEYDGCLVVCMNEWELFDKMTCVITHRAILMAPGVLGVAYDVTPDMQRDGMGLSVTQWKMPPFQGMTYFQTTFKIGATILDPNYIVAACKFIEPED